MDAGADLAAVAGLIANRPRAAMLDLLLDGGWGIRRATSRDRPASLPRPRAGTWPRLRTAVLSPSNTSVGSAATGWPIRMWRRCWRPFASIGALASEHVL